MDRKSQADDDEDDTRHKNTVLLFIEFLVHHFLIKILLNKAKSLFFLCKESTRKAKDRKPRIDRDSQGTTNTAKEKSRAHSKER